MPRLMRTLAILAAITVLAASCELQEQAGTEVGDEVPDGLAPPTVGVAGATGVERVVAEPTGGESEGNAPTTTTAAPGPTTTEAAPTTTAGPASTTTAPPSTTTAPPTTTTTPPPPPAGVAYFNGLQSANDWNRLDHFVAYRDPFVVNTTTGSSDHAPVGDGVDCTASGQTRDQNRSEPHNHVYMCLPGGNPAEGHGLAFTLDTSGYGFAGTLPDQVFEGVTEVAVDINATTTGFRNFVEIKVIPASQTFTNGMPCGPDIPCNDGWDYHDIGAVGITTAHADGVGFAINTPDAPDGHQFHLYDPIQHSNGDIEFRPCSEAGGFCFKASAHDGNPDIETRYQHVFRDNGDGTLSFGVERADGTFAWATAPGSFPSGPVRVVVAFHNYTGLKDGEGPGWQGNHSPSQGGLTWHWDDLTVRAATSTPSIDWYGGLDPDHIVTPDGCIAFSMGMKNIPWETDVLPRFSCPGDTPI